MDKKAQVQDLQNQIKEILRIAGVTSKYNITDPEQQEKIRELDGEIQLLYAPRVKDLIAQLEKCDPEAIVIVSEKWGRGGAQYSIRQGFTDANFMEYCSKEQQEKYQYPAIEISCGF